MQALIPADLHQRLKAQQLHLRSSKVAYNRALGHALHGAAAQLRMEAELALGTNVASLQADLATTLAGASPDAGLVPPEGVAFDSATGVTLHTHVAWQETAPSCTFPKRLRLTSVTSAYRIARGCSLAAHHLGVARPHTVLC